jgi:endonuclease YncB( thermonuclease family)
VTTPSARPGPVSYSAGDAQVDPSLGGRRRAHVAHDRRAGAGRGANEAIIRAGFAETYRRFEYVKKPQFQAAEREARDAKRGMWANGAGRK